jgi:hypothetical protein
MGERMREAAAETGERLKQRATQQGLNTQGMKDLAREAVDTFKDKVSGKAASGTPNPSSVSGGSPSNDWRTS